MAKKDIESLPPSIRKKLLERKTPKWLQAHKDPRETWIIEGAEHFIAYVKRGAGSITSRAETLEDAKVVGKVLADRMGKRVIIYAIRGASQAYVTTVLPNIKGK